MRPAARVHYRSFVLGYEQCLIDLGRDALNSATNSQKRVKE